MVRLKSLLVFAGVSLVQQQFKYTNVNGMLFQADDSRSQHGIVQMRQSGTSQARHTSSKCGTPAASAAHQQQVRHITAKCGTPDAALKRHLW
jgi:hypothetical protein